MSTVFARYWIFSLLSLPVALLIPLPWGPIIGSVWLGLVFFCALSPLKQFLNRIKNFSDQGGASLDPTRVLRGEWGLLEEELQKIAQKLKKQDALETRDRIELDALLESVTLPVVAVDPSEEILFCNPSFREDFGFSGEQGSRLASVLREVDVLAAFRWTLGHGDVQVVETRPLVQGGRVYSLHVQPFVLGSKVVGAVGVFLDMTQARLMDRVHTDFIANVSHELRTPLTSIKGFAEALPEDVPGAAAIRRNADRMLALVQDLMDLAHLENSGSLKQNPFNPEAVSQAALLQLVHRFPAVRSRVVAAVSGEAWFGDAGLLEQVVINLVENALLHSGPEAKIQVTWRSEQETQHLIVTDQGSGIAPQHLSRVFERFYRAEADRSRDRGGTGLGLAIVKHIIERHAGSVSVVSELGSGSTFTCAWPCEGHSPLATHPSRA